jgi:hypothetical protein
MQTSLLKNFIKGSSDLTNDEKKVHREIDGIADFLISFDPKNAAFYYFHKGEISLALHMHPKAVIEYFTALERYGIVAQPADNAEIKKVFNSLFATLNPEAKYQSLKKLALSTQTLKAYKYYITIFPSLDTSKEIYQKSFLLHLDEKLYPDAEQLLLLFQSQYPAEEDAKKRMTKSLIDRYIKDKNIENIARWATFLNENKSFDMAEMKTLTQSLANLHLDQNKVKEIKNKTEALDDLVLSLEIFEEEKTKTWIKRFIKLNPKLTTEDTKLITVAAKLFHDRREYSMAHESFKKINSISRISGNELELATINAFLMTGSKLNKTLKLIEEFGVDKNDPAVTKTVKWMISNLYYQSKFSEISTVPTNYLSFIKISDLLFYYYSPIHQKEHTDIANAINLFYPEQLEKMKVSELNLQLLKEKISIFKKQTLIDKTPFNPEQFSAKVGAFLEYYKAIDDLVFPQDFGIKDIVIDGRKSAFLHLSETLTKYNPITSDKDLKRAVKGELKKIIKKLKKKYPYL